ncbi:hypothetical protein ruthe_02252 [Rubellimicrobium thermophilum DSM 16684]|uniref:Uncharacterized protein n=1 Tax=Rubellimicrobium thermophilum DSM 16684 TaxID=1123069 RepID=S9QXS0_9RHOB|nr:hypothetical protein ruthe_02252 [Rubellimicrobium thermophilum DSM 16684]
MGDLGRGAIGRQHDAPALIEERVEGMEEFLLRRFLAGKELDIVHKQHIEGADRGLEVHHPPLAQGGHEADHELFRRQVEDTQARIALAQPMGGGLQQMRLAQAHPAMEEERIEACLARGDPQGRGMGQRIGRTDGKALEGQARIEAALLLRRRAQRGRRGRGHPGRPASPGSGSGQGSGRGRRHLDPVSPAAGLGKGTQDLLAQAAGDIGAEKGRRRLEAGNAALDGHKAQGGDPALEAGRPEAVAQGGPGALPQSGPGRRCPTGQCSVQSAFRKARPEAEFCCAIRHRLALHP